MQPFAESIWIGFINQVGWYAIFVAVCAFLAALHYQDKKIAWCGVALLILAPCLWWAAKIEAETKPQAVEVINFDGK